MVRHLNAADPAFEEQLRCFLDQGRGQGPDIAATVSAIIADVRARGGIAVAEYTSRFDGVSIDPHRLETDRVVLDELAARCPNDLAQAIDYAHERIVAYHQAQRPADYRYTDSSGVELGWRWTALDSVGVYVPGGRASYPSSVLMNIVPAVMAGVERIVMTAPAPSGELSPAVAYAAIRAGVTEFYPIGGAQAVAALAWGAGVLAPVDKIVGPGNAYVAEAKRQVFGRVGIDTIAGPSEILVIADASANPEWIAADLLSQAEHDPSSQSILISLDAEMSAAVLAAIEVQLSRLPTAETARQSWQNHGAIISAADYVCAARAANIIAAEHVELCVGDPDSLLAMIRHAGAVFLGHHTPEALGDYVTGSNHVLPTSRAARYSSGLGLTDFLKRMSIQRAGPNALRLLAPAALTLAEAEGLPAHAWSVAVRTDRDF